MSNEERFWESAIAEAVRDDAPPDVAPRVLAELADDAAKEGTRIDGRPRGRVIRAFARYGLEIGTAAAVVLAIAWATGLLRFGGPEEVTAPKDYAAAPGAVVNENEDFIELQRGWLLVTTGAPEVRCGNSKLTEVDGRVLLHAGTAPTRAQVASVREWLNANKLEEEMITNPKRWIAGAALAAMVLSGSANLDGERIDAQDEDESTEVVWHKVRSVMDIDNLPEGAEYVNADGINAALLDFLAEVKTLKGIRVRDGNGLRNEHLESLRSLPELEWLDIRDTTWIDYKENASAEALKDIATLKYVGMDLIPANLGISTEARLEYGYAVNTLPTLNELSKRGVEIELGSWNPKDQESLRQVLEALPTLTSLTIRSASVGEMKVMSEYDRLRTISLYSYRGGEIGLAYLARKGFLKDFTIEADELSLEEIHQISSMPLHTLHIDAKFTSSPEQCFSLLSQMKSLRDLELGLLGISKDGARAFIEFQTMQRLARFKLGFETTELYGASWLLAHCVPTRSIELTQWYSEVPFPAKVDMPTWIFEGSAGRHLEEIRFNFLEGLEFSRDKFGDDNLEGIKTFPNLKRIEVRRGGFDEPDMQDEFVRWLKEGLPDVEVVVVP